MAKDLRSWIQQLDKHGELVHIDREVDPATNIGALNHLSREKALLFKNVKGYPDWRVLGQAPANIRHMAVAMDSTLAEVVPKIVHLYEQPPTPAVEVQSAPCKEQIFHGDEVDLKKLPVHIHHAKDGGFYMTCPRKLYHLLRESS